MPLIKKTKQSQTEFARERKEKRDALQRKAGDIAGSFASYNGSNNVPCAGPLGTTTYVNSRECTGRYIEAVENWFTNTGSR